MGAGRARRHGRMGLSGSLKEAEDVLLGWHDYWFEGSQDGRALCKTDVCKRTKDEMGQGVRLPICQRHWCALQNFCNTGYMYYMRGRPARFNPYACQVMLCCASAIPRCSPEDAGTLRRPEPFPKKGSNCACSLSLSLMQSVSNVRPLEMCF